MALIKNVSVPVFEKDAILRGDNIRVRRATESAGRNGTVSRVTDTMLEFVFVDVHNNANRFMQIEAKDVAVGLWEIWWSSDMQTVNYQPVGGGSA